MRGSPGLWQMIIVTGIADVALTVVLIRRAQRGLWSAADARDAFRWWWWRPLAVLAAAALWPLSRSWSRRVSRRLRQRALPRMTRARRAMFAIAMEELEAELALAATRWPERHDGEDAG